jgi:hypothetical protein
VSRNSLKILDHPSLMSVGGGTMIASSHAVSSLAMRDYNTVLVSLHVWDPSCYVVVLCCNLSFYVGT